MIATLTISAIAVYFGDKILEHFIQEEIWYKRIWQKNDAFKLFGKKIKYNTCPGCQFSYECKGGCIFMNEINLC